MQKKKIKRWYLLAFLSLIIAASFFAVCVLAKLGVGWTLAAYALGIIAAVAAAFIIIIIKK